MCAFLINPYLFVTTACSSGISTSGLTAYWKMDGASTDSISSLNGADTSVSYLSSPAMFGQAMSLSGSNQYSQMGNSNLLQTAVTWSLSAWFYPKTLNSYQSVIDNYGFDGLGPYRILINNANNTLLVSIGANDILGFSSNTITANAWNHVVVTKTNTSTAKVYINGIEYDFGINTTRTSSNSRFVIGSRWRNSNSTYPDLYFNGLIDDVGYFQRTLSLNEVRTIYTAATVNGCRLSSL